MSWYHILHNHYIISPSPTHNSSRSTVYPKKYAHGFCFAVLCCGYSLTDFPISLRLTSLALWQSNACPSASKATLMNMDKYFMWIHYEQLHNHNKSKHSKTVCIFLGIYCSYGSCACRMCSSNSFDNTNMIISLFYRITLIVHCALDISRISFFEWITKDTP